MSDNTIEVMVDDTGTMETQDRIDPSKINDPVLHHAAWVQSDAGQASIRQAHASLGRDLTLEKQEADVASALALEGKTLDAPVAPVEVAPPGEHPADTPTNLPAGFTAPTA